MFFHAQINLFAQPQHSRDHFIHSQNQPFQAPNEKSIPKVVSNSDLQCSFMTKSNVDIGALMHCPWMLEWWPLIYKNLLRVRTRGEFTCLWPTHSRHLLNSHLHHPPPIHLHHGDHPKLVWTLQLGRSIKTQKPYINFMFNWNLGKSLWLNICCIHQFTKKII